MIEFCYTWPSGRIEVRYRVEKGSERYLELKETWEMLKERDGDKCPYFYRQQSDQEEVLKLIPNPSSMDLSYVPEKGRKRKGRRRGNKHINHYTK